MQRIAILGRGGAGKSVLAQRLATLRGLPVIELDSIFWQSGLRPMPEAEWTRVHDRLVAPDTWIIDGDLGPYDTHLAERLSAADTVVVLDFPLWRCAWRSLRRSRENREYWQWVCHYGRDSLPDVDHAIARHAKHADVHTLRSSRDVRKFLDAGRT